MDELKKAAEEMRAKVEHWDYSQHLKGLPPLEPIKIKLNWEDDGAWDRRHPHPEREDAPCFSCLHYDCERCGSAVYEIWETAE